MYFFLPWKITKKKFPRATVWMNPRISFVKIQLSHFESDPKKGYWPFNWKLSWSLACLCLNSITAGTVERSSAMPAQIMSCRSLLHPNLWESVTPATLCSSSAAPPTQHKIAAHCHKGQYQLYIGHCAVPHYQSDQNGCTRFSVWSLHFT